MKFFALTLTSLLVAQTTFAANVQIKSQLLPKKRITIEVSQNALDELSFIAKKTVVVTDCNERFYEVEPVLVDGSGDGFYDLIYVNESVSSTVMGCSTEKRTLHLQSEPMKFKAKPSPMNGDKTLLISLIVDQNTTIELVK